MIDLVLVYGVAVFVLVLAIHNNYAHYTLIDIKGTNGDSPPANICCTWPANIDIVSMMVKNDIPKTLHKSLGIGVII
jgi:hypothetical protein